MSKATRKETAKSSARAPTEPRFQWRITVLSGHGCCLRRCVASNETYGREWKSHGMRQTGLSYPIYTFKLYNFSISHPKKRGSASAIKPATAVYASCRNMHCRAAMSYVPPASRSMELKGKTKLSYLIVRFIRANAGHTPYGRSTSSQSWPEFEFYRLMGASR